MILAAVLTFAVSYIFALRGIDPHHDGVMLKTAWDVSNGLVLFRDTYTQYGALSIYYFAVFVRLFGAKVTSIHIAACLLYALSAAGLFRIVRRYTSSLAAFAAPMIGIGMAAFYFWNFHPWPNVLVLCMTVWTALCFIRFAEQQSGKNLFAAGLLSAGMFWCKQPAGLILGFGTVYLIGMYLVGSLDRKSLWGAIREYFIGNLALHAALLLAIIAQGAFRDWWHQSIYNAYYYVTHPTAETAAAMPDSILKFYLVGLTDNPKYDWIWRVLTYGTLGYLIVLTVLAFRSKKDGGPSKTLLGCIAFAAISLSGWIQYYPTLCYRHVFWSDYPMFGVLLVAFYQGAEKLVSRKGKKPTLRMLRILCTVCSCALLCVLCSTNLVVRLRLGKSRLFGGGTGAEWHTREYAEENTVILFSDETYHFMDGLYLSAEETEFYRTLFDTMRELQERYPEKNVVNTTPNALFSMFSPNNVHLHPFAEKADGYPEQTEVVLHYIETQHPIVLSYRMYDGYHPEAYLTQYNGDWFRWAPMYILVPEGGQEHAAG